MTTYIYQNTLIGKKQLRQLLAWSFTNYDSMQACVLADELKYLGFKYASQAGISISIEDLKIPFVKNLMLEKANKEIINTEKIYLKGKITEVERFQKIIDTWSLTSESLKEQVIYYFKNYDPLNSVYIMAFSGARGNLSQVRQLVGMRGLMSDPSGEIMKLPIKKNFREGLTITDYLMSGYGARKGIVDTALKTANSGYLTRRLIDVAQDILIREKDCLTTHSFLLSINKEDQKKADLVYDEILGRVLNRPIFDPETQKIIIDTNTQITPNLIEKLKKKNISKVYVRSPLTCNLYRAICQKCYGWDLSNENLVEIGEAVGILAGQSIGEPGTQLTMRTFHTGGIFTSEARQQIISPVNGIIRFYKTLKTVILRTNRGEDVLITKNSGSLILIPDDPNQQLIKMEVLRNTILFPKNNQYIVKDTVIGELINLNKQIKTEIKPILSDTCGEIFMPHLKNKINLLNNNKLIWILSGQLYSSSSNSFINFYPDHKLNKYSYIFRTKIVTHYSGLIEFINNKASLYQRVIQIKNKKYSLINTQFQKLATSIGTKNYLLIFENLKYLFNLEIKNSRTYLQLTRNNQFGTLITNSFRTLTGGSLHYNYQNLLKINKLHDNISYYSRGNKKKRYNPLIVYRTIFWLEEEVHKINCEQNIVLVEHEDFISEGFEIIPGLFSKTSGIVNLKQKNNFVQTITIKSGLVYEGKKFKNTSKKIYFPGEVIFSNIQIKKVSFCEHIIGKKNEQLLLRPIELYEFSYLTQSFNKKNDTIDSNSNFELQSTSFYFYKPNQILRGKKDLSLITNSLSFKTTKLLNDNVNIELLNNKKTKSVDFQISEKISLVNYIPPYLRYKNIQSCALVQPKQFIDQYTTLGYLEAITLNSLEIIKIKIKNQDIKQILLISNNDCLTIEKNRFADKQLNDFIINSSNVHETGKIIIENDQFLTLQKGKPYFFPNCKNNDLTSKTNLQYKIVSSNRIQNQKPINRSILVNYYNSLKLSLKNRYSLDCPPNSEINLKSEFSKLFLKKNGKLYSSLIPQFLKKISITNKSSKSKLDPIIRSNNLQKPIIKKIDRTLLIKNSELSTNNYKKLNESDYQLTLMRFIEHPFIKTTKSIGLYSITEDYFEQDVNSVFCKNSEFIETGETLGLLNLEKEITGDIVQGLPRIEEILEARKKNLIVKRIPTSQKKGLLVQKTTLDPAFEFRKIGTTVKENDKVNPHKLLKVYFNYYGLIKSFSCDRTKRVKYNRLMNNYEGSYKSFKKVQSFILNSVQSVYQSQGVTINNKHLEVIIKQMTTKVLITYEGNTPLLRREVIDLYHMDYINQIISEQEKQPACYVPLLLGITKAALNNPSFISAASFQETTRVLSKAAIEGRIDWLRGLKENIIIGHLIPAGTGSQNYRNCFKNNLISVNVEGKRPIIKNVAKSG
uniref:RNA polymerase beta'' subunit n=1 Tax=Haslea karadagensis TaxID=1146996 RepID=UPI0022050EC5|nr:RNA polymerase beta'' subunit [Haslea karadagensis]UXN44871.1 RNA polymerase beta'' subunit [Haslea karadagensis]UXN45132.1 RNA polymerase beta'' subunit [Haslea karadagensis]